MTNEEKLAMVNDHEEWLWVRWKALARCQSIRAALIIPKYGPV